MQVKLVLGLLVALILVIFTAQNYQVVEVRFLFWKIEMSRAVMLMAVLCAGMVSGWLLGSLSRRKSGE